jgi:hypothetical protein
VLLVLLGARRRGKGRVCRSRDVLETATRVVDGGQCRAREQRRALVNERCRRSEDRRVGFRGLAGKREGRKRRGKEESSVCRGNKEATELNRARRTLAEEAAEQGQEGRQEPRGKKNHILDKALDRRVELARGHAYCGIVAVRGIERCRQRLDPLVQLLHRDETPR